MHTSDERAHDVVPVESAQPASPSPSVVAQPIAAAASSPVGAAAIGSAATGGRIQRMASADPAIGNGSGTPAARIQPSAIGRVVQRDWRAVDEAANAKRLAHAHDDYMFDKRMSDDGGSGIDDRLAEQRAEVAENDVTISPVFAYLYRKNPELALRQFGYTGKQAATAKARVRDKDGIPKPNELLPPSAVSKHLGKFANGAHAFIDPSTSKKIEGEIDDPRFRGWGIDSNFVAPLDEANALNAKAQQAGGIEKIEEELGIPNHNWSRTAWNPKKELVRWVIPKPKLDVGEEEVGILLEMATGREWGADPQLWVAGGLTKGGASEAVLKAIPRENLIKHLASGEIRQKVETYPKTPDDIV